MYETLLNTNPLPPDNIAEIINTHMNQGKGEEGDGFGDESTSNKSLSLLAMKKQMSTLSDLKKSMTQKDIQILKSDELDRNTAEAISMDDRMIYSSGLLAVKTRKNVCLVHFQG